MAQEYVDLGYMNSLAVTTPQMLKTLGHEGRIPPLTTDSRVDPQFPMWGGVFRNIGDDTDSTVRLRRVWDSWTTDYTNVPWQTLDPSLCPPMMPPPYPSYPPPYPVPLTGIQIQIRVVDPTNQRVKIHTLRHDFSKNMN